MSVKVHSGTGVARRRNALGFCTKELCSGLFVSRRRLDDLIAHDLSVICQRFAGGLLDPAEIEFTVDAESSTVVGVLPDGTSHRAVASGDKGATLVDTGRHDPPGRPCHRQEADPLAWPDGDGDTADPRYDSLRAGVRHHLDHTGARGVAVVHRGELVVQEFAAGFGPAVPTRGWSTAKTLTALVVGWLAERGTLDPYAPAPIPAWRRPGDPRGRITTIDLLRLSSGLAVRRFDDGSDGMLSDADDYFAMYFRPTSVNQQVSTVDIEAASGELFSYKSIDHLAIGVVFQEIFGANAHGLLSRTVLPALGLRHSLLETDVEGVPLLCGAWYTTPADLARIGTLILHRGRLSGRRVLSQEWVDTMLTESPATRADRFAGPAGMRHSYGASVWLNRDGHLPGDQQACYALGSLGQVVFVLPQQDLVIARTALEQHPKHLDLIRAVRTAF